MKRHTTTLSVINIMTSRACAGICLLSLLSLSLPGGMGTSLLAEENSLSGESPYVRVKWRQDFEGLTHREFLVKEARIVEVSEYSGVLMDAKGHVAVYIPDPLKLSFPQGSFSVSSRRGKDFSAELLGVDQRMSLAFLKVSVPSENQAVFGNGIPNRVFHVLSWTGSGWNSIRYKLIDVADNVFGPVQTIKAAQAGNEGQRWENSRNKADRRSSFVLDQEDRLIGLGVSSSMLGLSRKTMEFKVFPIAAVRESLSQLRKQKGGVLESGWMGVYIDATDSGVQVTRVVPDSPALAVGIRAGDTIISVNKQAHIKVEDFIQAVKWSGPERNVNLTVERDSVSKDFIVLLGRSPVYQKPAYEWALDLPSVMNGPKKMSQQVQFRPIPSFQRRSFGIQVGPLTAQLAEFFKSPTGTGLLVEAVEADSLAEQIGLKAGDVLIRIDDMTVKSSSDLARLMAAHQEPIVLSFVRDGKVIKQKIVFR
jgi:S1-C subfamily serine protease